MHRLHRRIARLIVFLPALLLPVTRLCAVTVHGTVTDTIGRPISGATVALVYNGVIVMNTITHFDGSYQLTCGQSGRFYVISGGDTLRQLGVESFYGATLDSIAKNIILEQAYSRESVVTSDIGVPRTDAEASGSLTTLTLNSFNTRLNIMDALRLAPGVTVEQQGQRGADTSVYIRGGNPDANKVLMDGVPINDIGGAFNASTISNIGVSQVEVYRGANSTLWGSDASAGVISFTTPRGSTPFPSVLYESDLGNFSTYRNTVQVGGMGHRLDYYGAFTDLQTSNSVPGDEHHNISSITNLGYALNGSTSIRATVRDANNAAGKPGAYEFTGVANNGKLANQDVLLSGTIDHLVNEFWHTQVRYGLARKRAEDIQWSPTGNLIDGNYFGYITTIKGANGYEATGQALMHYGSTVASTENLVSNRDNLYAESDYRFTPVVQLLLGFRYEDERGADKEAVYGTNQSIERSNYDYTAAINGSWPQHIYYSIGGSFQKNQLYGTQFTPRGGTSLYLVKPGRGVAHGTRLTFNVAKGVGEPSLDAQFGSLYQVLEQYGGQGTASQDNIKPIRAQRSRTYDGGLEQNFFNERVTLRATYFHNEYGDQVETVPASVLPALLPNLSSTQQQNLENLLSQQSVQSLTANTLAYRAQGVEGELDYGVTSNIVTRVGYTWLESAVQRSFSSDAVGPSYNPALPGIAIGNVSPLIGARPFRRPPNSGFATVTYTGKKLTLVGTLAAASRSDDSTYLGGADQNLGNSLLLPNRDLDHGYTKMDVSFTYKLDYRISLYGQLDNVLSQQHMAPLGYGSLPAAGHLGLRYTWGHLKKTP